MRLVRLLHVPEHRRRRFHVAAHVGSKRHRHVELAERRVGRELSQPNLKRLGELLAPGRIGGPREIVAQLNAELRKIVNDPEMKARLGTVGFEAFSSTPEELGDFVKAQLVKWTKMIKEAGIEPQ